MLKGYIKCNDIDKLLLSYIHFELTKKEQAKVALHLRNCPVCMEKYTKIQKRKRELKFRMREIEKEIRMQNELSSYMDNEANEDVIFIVEGMLLCDEKYKKELFLYEKLRRYLTASKKIVQQNAPIVYARKITAKIRLREMKLKRIKNFFSRQVLFPRHGFAK